MDSLVILFIVQLYCCSIINFSKNISFIYLLRVHYHSFSLSKDPIILSVSLVCRFASWKDSLWMLHYSWHLAIFWKCIISSRVVPFKVLTFDITFYSGSPSFSLSNQLTKCQDSGRLHNISHFLGINILSPIWLYSACLLVFFSLYILIVLFLCILIYLRDMIFF